MSQTRTLNAIVIVIVHGVQEWASEDLLEASTNWAMKTDILRLEIGKLGIGYFGIIFFKVQSYGGIYVDVDAVAKRPFGPVFSR